MACLLQVRGWGDVLDICVKHAIAELGPGKETAVYLERAQQIVQDIREEVEEMSKEIPLFCPHENCRRCKQS